MDGLRTINVQAAIFVNKIIERPDTLYYKILPDLGGVLDQPPHFNNMPDEVPADIPRIFSSSKDNKFQLNVSKNRVDLFINIDVNTKEGEDRELKRFKSMTTVICNQISSMYGINRIGSISTTISTEQKEKDAFIETYINNFEKDTLAEAEVRLNNVKSFKGVQINNIKRLSIGHVESQVFNGNCLLIQLDINNQTLLPGESDWIELLDHLLESSSPAAAEKALRGE